MKYKIVAIVTILLAGIIGVVIPLLGKAFPALIPEKDIFFVIKAFAGGVILATGFIPVLPDDYESLNSPKLNENPWAKFPFTGLVAAIGTLMVDAGASSYFTRIHLKKARTEVIGDNVMNGGGDAHDGRVHVHTHGHAHGSAEVAGWPSTEILRHRVISQAKFKNRATILMALFFRLTPPIGIAIGIEATKTYNEDSPKARIIEGILNAAKIFRNLDLYGSG